jgi:hypothetical protein
MSNFFGNFRRSISSFKQIKTNAISIVRRREENCLKAASRRKPGTYSNTYWMAQYYKAKLTRLKIQTHKMDSNKIDQYVDGI